MHPIEKDRMDALDAEFEAWMDVYTEVPCCPACGDVIDYCQGHGEIGDPDGFAILSAHDNEVHDDCHRAGCEVAMDAHLDRILSEMD